MDRFVRELWGWLLTIACIQIVLALLVASSHDDQPIAGFRYGPL